MYVSVQVYMSACEHIPVPACGCQRTTLGSINLGFVFCFGDFFGCLVVWGLGVLLCFVLFCFVLFCFETG